MAVRLELDKAEQALALDLAKQLKALSEANPKVFTHVLSKLIDQNILPGGLDHLLRLRHDMNRIGMSDEGVSGLRAALIVGTLDGLRGPAPDGTNAVGFTTYTSAEPHGQELLDALFKLAVDMAMSPGQGGMVDNAGEHDIS